MTACWDGLRPFLGPADGELVKDLLTMRSWGLYSLVPYPEATEAETIEFGEKLVADCEQAFGPGHRTPGRRGGTRHTPTSGTGATTKPSAPSRGCARTWSASFPPVTA